MRRLEIAIALIFVGLCLVIAVSLRDQPYWSNFAPGSAFLPFWVAGLGAVFALAQIYVSTTEISAARADWPGRAGALRVVMTVCGLWLFLALMPWLGTALTGGLFMLFVLLFVQRRRIVPSLATTLFTIGMVELIFILWLDIRLPRGIFGI